MKHSDTAERLHFFLAQQKLSRERFLQEIQNAITRSSLLSLLNGHRRPARTFALLLEWKWGFRADYLLHGKGEPWKSASSGKTGLSPLEQDVVTFMRESPQQAQEMQAALDKALLWKALFDKTERVLARLATVATHDVRYSAIATLTLEECWRLAALHRYYGDLLQARRVLKLTSRFLRRFVLPVDTGASALEALSPPLERRLREIDQALRDVRSHLDGADTNGSVVDSLLTMEVGVEPILADIAALFADRVELLDAAGIPVGELLARIKACRPTVDREAWAAELAFRIGSIGHVDPVPDPAHREGGLKLEFRRLLDRLSSGRSRLAV